MTNGDKIEKSMPFHGSVSAEDRHIFHKQVTPEPSVVMADKIPGVDECIVEQDGRAHVKISFEGRTMSELDHRQRKIEKFLDDNDIPHQGLCLFVCLTDEFMEKMEKIRKREQI